MQKKCMNAFEACSRSSPKSEEVSDFGWTKPQNLQIGYGSALLHPGGQDAGRQSQILDVDKPPKAGQFVTQFR